MTNPHEEKNQENVPSDDPDMIEGGGFILEKKTRKKPAKRAKRARKVEKKNYVESQTEDEELDYVPESEEHAKDESESEDIKSLGSDSEDIPISDVPAPAPKKRKVAKKAKKPKKPRKKVDYFLNMTNRLYTHHPQLKNVFADLKAIPDGTVKQAHQPPGMLVTLLPFQLEGLNWLITQEKSIFGGGILADEMGMGKTIQTIALFMSEPDKGPNLVVVPPVAMVQWKNEIEAHTNGALKVYLFHGSNRTNRAEDLKEYNVIMTTYSVLELVYRKQQYGFKRVDGVHKERSVLHSMKFYRVVLDEAHSIKDRQSGTAKSVNNLKCEKKWCLSGTPLQNRIGELYSLIRFLKVEPFCQYFCTKCECSSLEWNFISNRYCADCGHLPMQHTNFFNHFFLKNIIKYGIADAEGNIKEEAIVDEEDVPLALSTTEFSANQQARGVEAFGMLQMLLSKLMLRRTKTQRADDLGLPPKTIEVRYDNFNPEEKDLYQSLYLDSLRQFNEYVEEGVVLNNYANIFTLITRMRQMADHPDLVLKRMADLLLPEAVICQLCDDQAEDAIQSKCNHRFCRLCIKEYVDLYVGDKLECPVCHIGLVIDLEAAPLEVAEIVEKRLKSTKSSIVGHIDMLSGRWRLSTKIEAVVEELYKTRNDNRTIKTIIFLQFTSFLDLVDWRLRRAGFRTVRLQGQMSPQQRASTIEHFMNNVGVEVFLVSLKAGGVALNLTEASQIFIMDPWWHLAAEEQADRVHRIRQMRPVRIVKFCIADSIEKKILELQDKKADMVKATIEGDQSSASRLSTADLQFLFSH